MGDIILPFIVYASPCVALSLDFKVSYFSHSLTPMQARGFLSTPLSPEVCAATGGNCTHVDLLSDASCFSKNIFLGSFLHVGLWHHALTLDLTLR